MERWRPIAGFEGLYEVSDFGRVRSFRRKTALGRPLKLDCGRGSISVSLYGGGRRRRALVHHLVLETFICPRPAGLECRHVNGDFTDNRLPNLMWGTHAENIADKWAHGTMPRGEQCNGAKLTSDQVVHLRQLRASGWSQKRLAEHFRISVPSVSLICSGKMWTHLPVPPYKRMYIRS